MFTHRIQSFFLLSLALPVLGTPVKVNDQPSHTLQSGEVVRTIARRADPSAYPWANDDDPLIENEFKWLGWDKDNADDRRDGQKIHEAFREWHEFAQAGGKEALNHQGVLFNRWFGKPETPKDVGDTFKNMMDLERGVATANIASMVLRRDDYNTKPDERCENRPNRRAYTTPESREFHLCRSGIDAPLNSMLKCEDFDESVSAKMRTVSMIFLHETTHYDHIQGGVFQIIDNAGKAYESFKLDDEDKVENAQSYAWLAADAYWSAKCKRTFNDPAPGTADIDDPEDDPTHAPIEPPKGPTKALTIVGDIFTNPGPIEE